MVYNMCHCITADVEASNAAYISRRTKFEARVRRGTRNKFFRRLLGSFCTIICGLKAAFAQ